jgi:hypothetical protein
VGTIPFVEGTFVNWMTLPFVEEASSIDVLLVHIFTNCRNKHSRIDVPRKHQPSMRFLYISLQIAETNNQE